MKIELYPGAGKAEVELQRISELASLPNAAALPVFRGRQGIVSMTSRPEVESMDLGRLVCGFGRNVNLERIRDLHGRTSITIAGYEDDARELYEIPEVRRFYAAAFQRCPVLILAADLRNECLRAAVFCALKTLTVIHRFSTERPEVRVESSELERFFMAHLRAQAVLHKKLGWSKARGVKELKILEDYLGVYEP